MDILTSWLLCGRFSGIFHFLTECSVFSISPCVSLFQSTILSIILYSAKLIFVWKLKPWRHLEKTMLKKVRTFDLIEYPRSAQSKIFFVHFDVFPKVHNRTPSYTYNNSLLHEPFEGANIDMCRFSIYRNKIFAMTFLGTSPSADESLNLEKSIKYYSGISGSTCQIRKMITRCNVLLYAEYSRQLRRRYQRTYKRAKLPRNDSGAKCGILKCSDT